MWYVVYKIADGAIVSTGQSVATDSVLAAKGYGKVELAENPQKCGNVWDTKALTFKQEAIPRDSLSASEFLALFSDAEIENIIDASVNHTKPAVRKKAATLLKKLEIQGTISSLDSPTVVQAIHWLESVGLIGTDRAVEILA